MVHIHFLEDFIMPDEQGYKRQVHTDSASVSVYLYFVALFIVCAEIFKNMNPVELQNYALPSLSLPRQVKEISQNTHGSMPSALRRALHAVFLLLSISHSLLAY